MSENLETRLENIDLATLTLLVRSALSSETAVVVKWNYDTMQGGYSGNSSIYRFLGSGQDQGREIVWSLILKILQRGNQVDNPAHSRYWKREAVAFESGILEHLPGSVIAPKCFGITKPSDDECWIWLEEVKNETGSHWPLEQYGSVARHLGQFNGAYLTGEPQPAKSWLSVNWLRELVSGSASAIDLLRDSLKHPLISRWFPESVAQDTFRLWEERETILDMLDRLPQTFCHRDANWRNLFYQRTKEGNDHTVAVDWAESGQGAIGEELVGLTGSSIVFGAIEMTKAHDLDRVVFENYLLGLQDAGWHNDPQLVRFGFTAASALHYSFKALGFLLSVVLDDSKHAWFEETYGQTPGRKLSIEEMMDRGSMVNRFLLDLADEARGLQRIVPKA